jgi:hypothetical protein
MPSGRIWLHLFGIVFDDCTSLNRRFQLGIAGLIFCFFVRRFSGTDALTFEIAQLTQLEIAMCQSYFGEVEGGEEVKLAPNIPGVTVWVNARLKGSEGNGVMIKVTGGHERRIYQITARALFVSDTYLEQSLYGSVVGGFKTYSGRNGTDENTKHAGPTKWATWYHDESGGQHGIWAPAIGEDGEGDTLIFYDRPGKTKGAPRGSGYKDKDFFAKLQKEYFLALDYIVVDRGLVGVVKWRAKSMGRDGFSFSAKSLLPTQDLVNLARDAFGRHGTTGPSGFTLGNPKLPKKPGVGDQLKCLVIPNNRI